MKTWTLIKNSLFFYWRTNLGVLLGVAVSTAILVGALVIGDSVRHSLKTLALSRLGDVKFAVVPQNRFFRAELANELEKSLDSNTAPVLLLRGIAVNNEATARANNVQVLGVDERFWQLGNSQSFFDTESNVEIVLNRRLAEHLDVGNGDEILLRVEKTGLLSRDAPLSTDEDSSVAMRLNVKAIASDSDFGRFSLKANQIEPFNAFLPLSWLQEKVEFAQRANMLLVGEKPESKLEIEDVNEALRNNWKLRDANLELRELPEQDVIEIRTDRVFLDEPLAFAATKIIPESIEILTYFVNELRIDDKATPYSIVTAIDNIDGSFMPSDMRDDEIIINQWLADDLQAEIGDMLQLKYFVVGKMRKLEERSSSFRIHSIIPIEGVAADQELMPNFPGISEAENCRDWEPGIPINLDKIREKDEQYWDNYRGTPKAFVTLNAGQKMWGNRFGNLTAIRFPSEKITKEQVKNAIKRKLKPESIGLFFQPVRKQALEASTEALDFGQLFLGLSFFLIIASLLLTGLLFVFGTEQRTEEVGTLLAMGFPPPRVRRLFLFEGALLALFGGLIGTAGGIAYTKIMLYALSTVWKGAIGGYGRGVLYYYAKPLTLVIGTAIGIIIAILAIWITLRKQAKRPARELLAFGAESGSNLFIPEKAQSRIGLWIGLIAIVGALIVLVLLGKTQDKQSATAFFISGTMLLIGGIGLSHALFSFLIKVSNKARMRIASLGLRNSVRRIGRSLTIVALLACGSFLIIAVGVNRRSSTQDIEKRSSGTGGFTLFAESSLPVYHDLNSQDGQKAYALNPDELKNVDFVSFRVHEGDDASCLNLNRVQKPRLLGINPEEMQNREAFSFVKTIKNSDENKWLLLNHNENDNIVPAIGDSATITWAIGKSVGDTLSYMDERGNVFKIKLVGMLTNSIFQGSLIISEDNFIQRFPSEDGYRTFLIDVPLQDSEEVSKTLSRSMQDVGMEITSTAQRLAEFNTVQNTYLSIFQILGGLAMLLGSIGLGVVVLRNVMERRNELALLRAVGFEKRLLQWFVLSEHWLLLILGLISGVIAGLVAVLPALQSAGTEIPYISLILTLFSVVISGMLWIWLSTILALRTPLLSALRNE